MTYRPAELAEIHLELLYETDERGLLLRSRDPEIVAPLLHLVRTVEGNRWLIAASLDEHVRYGLQETLESEPVPSSLETLEMKPPAPPGVREILRESRGRRSEYRGPAFTFPQDMAAPGVTVEVLLKARDAVIVPELGWIGAVGERGRPMCVSRNESREIVAVCHAARSTARAAEAGVETASEYRGRGLAAAVVAGWAAVVRAEGRVPVYSTSWSNLPSRAVARRLGLAMFGEDWSFGWPQSYVAGRASIT